MPPLFALDHVTAHHGNEVVLRDVTCTLPAGANCLYGPSGAGKTTLLRLLNRLADPVTGQVAYAGRDVRTYDVLALRRRVGYVAQLPALLPGTVADNVRFGPKLAGRDVDVARHLDQAGLHPAFADRPADRLSVGEQQRVMLARALALEPDVLLLDEPTSALDETARGAVEETLQALRHEADVSLVLVTHDAAQARRLAEWVVQLADGRVVAEGPSAELLPA